MAAGAVMLSSNIVLYFLYGLSFFYLGVAIATKDMKESRLALAGTLWLLAGFGFSHGLHEWLELFSMFHEDQLSPLGSFFLSGLKLFTLGLSFLFLFFFGLRLAGEERRLLQFGVPAFLFVLWLMIVFPSVSAGRVLFFERATTASRNIFGVVGGMVTAYGLITYTNTVKGLSPSVSKKIFWAGVFFVFYALLTGLVPSNSKLFFLPLPVEMFRAIAAMLITYFIVKGLNIFDIETREKLQFQLETLAQTEKLTSLGKLATGVAHEINNPLANASLNLELIRKNLQDNNGLSEVLTKKLSALGNNIERASVIAKELLQFSHRGHEHFIPCDIRESIEKALLALEYKMDVIVLRTSYRHRSHIMTNPTKITQVFINVITNALDAMPQGGELIISTHQEGPKVFATISDSGVGVAKCNQGRVFDPFFTTKELGRGTGLGLSICYGIIQQHGGEITIDSRAGHGTAVTIILPAEQQA